MSSRPAGKRSDEDMRPEYDFFQCEAQSVCGLKGAIELFVAPPQTLI